MNKKILTIATHDGKFHADEVFAIAILKKIYPLAKVIRTREKEALKQADMRVDVGGVYNPLTNDFDHHQNDFKEVGEGGIPYSSCGIIWKHFGRKLVFDDFAWEKINKKLVEFIDAQDTGVDYSNGVVSIYGIGQVINSFNPSWKSTEHPDSQFEKAVGFATTILENELSKAKDSSEARVYLKEAIEKNPHKKYIILETKGLPLDELHSEESLLYCISQRDNGFWNSLALRKKRESFENKKDFPKEWAGLTDEGLETVCGVKGAVFCHKNLFICVAKTKEAIVEMTKKAIES